MGREVMLGGERESYRHLDAMRVEDMLARQLHRQLRVATAVAAAATAAPAAAAVASTAAAVAFAAHAAAAVAAEVAEADRADLLFLARPWLCRRRTRGGSGSGGGCGGPVGSIVRDDGRVG